MLQAISDVVKNVAIIILLTTFLDMLLPNTNLQRFIKVVMGLFVMLAILTPLISLLDNDIELSAWQLSFQNEGNVDTVLAQGAKLSSLTESRAMEEYKSRIEKQMEALIKLIPEIGGVNCAVKLEESKKIGSIGKVSQTTIWVTLDEIKSDNEIKAVEPVKIEINEKEKPKADEEVIPNKTKDMLEEKIVNIISNYYSLDKSSIEVIFY